MATVPGSEAAEDVDGLKFAVGQLYEELKSLNRRVEGLTAAVERLQSVESGPGGGNASTVKPAAPAPTPAPTRTSMERTAIVVRPLPELAMAAMAETSLRGLPGVSEVFSSERFEDWARFTLDVAAGTDLIAEMKKAMPVRFTVIDAGPEEISIELHWAWGTSG